MMLAEHKQHDRIHVSFIANLGIVSLCLMGFPHSTKGSVLSWSHCKSMLSYSAQDGYKPSNHTTTTAHSRFFPLKLLTTVAILLSMHWVSLL